MFDLWKYLLGLTGSELFSTIMLPLGFLIVNLMGRAISNLGDIKSPETRIKGMLNTLSFYTDISLVSIASVFYAHQVLPEGREITTSVVGAFIIWLLITLFLFVLACLLAGFSGKKSSLLDKNSIIGIHIPNALGLASTWMSFIIYRNIGVN